MGAQSYERTSSAHQQRRSGEIGRPKGPKKRREKQPGVHKDQVKHFDELLTDNRLQLYSNDSFFVFLAVDLGFFSCLMPAVLRVKFYPGKRRDERIQGKT